MQPFRLMLIVTQGENAGKGFDLEHRGRCLIGRAADCDIRLSRRDAESDISRHHCELEFDPPNVWLRDLGSRNGTFLNNKPIGRRLSDVPVEEVDLHQFPSYSVASGDQIRVGHSVLRVGVIGGEG